MASEIQRLPETIEHAIRRIRNALTEAGIGEAAGDARRLVAAALNASSADLIRTPTRVVTTHEATRLAAYVDRRTAREPVSRILGEREFYGRSFSVTPDVLDPRPDTETIIDAALAIARSPGWAGKPIKILDIGTGSGAILLTLLAELPLATGLAIDISQPALDRAAANAAAIGVQDRAKFKCHDIFSGLPEGFDLVVSNPPYIPAQDLAGLDPEVARFDPHLALDGGCDGLAFYRAILAAWASSPHVQLSPRALVLEIGAGQSEAVMEIAEKSGCCSKKCTIETYRDLGNHIRCVTLATHSPAE